MCGFDVVNEIAKNNKIEMSQTKFEALYGKGMIKGKKVILLKPQMYMNLSGIPTRKMRDFYQIEDNKVIVIHDDIDVEEGKIKIRKTGGCGTHNGMKSILQELGNKEFFRIKVGVRKA